MKCSRAQGAAGAAGDLPGRTRGAMRNCLQSPPVRHTSRSMTEESLKNIALLIDADNTTPRGIDPVLTALAKLGQVNSL